MKLHKGIKKQEPWKLNTIFKREESSKTFGQGNFVLKLNKGIKKQEPWKLKTILKTKESSKTFGQVNLASHTLIASIMSSCYYALLT